MSVAFLEQVRQALVQAGSSGGRAVPFPNDLPSDFQLFSAAESVLRELGGLRIGAVGPAQECATSDLFVSPAGAAGLSEHVGTTTPDGALLYPLGELHHGHAFLFIDEHGAIYTYFDELERFAPSFEDALAQLVLSLRPGA